MVDLEQFREAVKCWRRSAAACGSSDDVKEADRLLSIIDSAKVAHKISAPTGHPPRAWTEQEKADCRAALQRIVEMEEADRAGKVEESDPLCVRRLNDCEYPRCGCTDSDQPAAVDGAAAERALSVLEQAAKGGSIVNTELVWSGDVDKALRTIRATLAQQPAPVVDEWCSDYHCAGDCGMRGHGWQHSPMVDDVRMARALEWVRALAKPCSAEEREMLNSIEEAIAAYDPSCGARTVRVVDDAMVEWKPRNRTEAAALAKIALAHLGVVDAYIDNAIARMETDAARAQEVQS